MRLLVALRSVSGHCAGVPKLTMNIDVKHDSNEPVRILHTSAEIRAAPSGQTYDPSKAAYFLGYGALESDGGQIGPGQQGYWTLGLALTPYHIMKIEEARDGRDLYLVTRFTTAAAELERTDPSKVKSFCSPDAVSEGYSSGHCPFRVARSDWIKILRDLGYTEHVLLEVPLRSVRRRKHVEKALKHLSAAWEHYSNGNDPEVLAACWAAFESLAKDHGFKSPDQNAFGALLEGVQEPEKREKVKFTLDYICRFLQIGRHVHGGQQVPVDHRDAEFGIVLTQSALAYLAKTTRRTGA